MSNLTLTFDAVDEPTLGAKWAACWARSWPAYEAWFLSTWGAPSYLGECSLAAVVDRDDLRLVRNYDLSPDLNEGLRSQTDLASRKP